MECAALLESGSLGNYSTSYLPISLPSTFHPAACPSPSRFSQCFKAESLSDVASSAPRRPCILRTCAAGRGSSSLGSREAGDGRNSSQRTARNGRRWLTIAACEWAPHGVIRRVVGVGTGSYAMRSGYCGMHTANHGTHRPRRRRAIEPDCGTLLLPLHFTCAVY